MQDLRLTINGKTHSFTADPEMPLLYLLREQLGLEGPKFGCGLEQCGSCMVLFDGVAEPSCKVPVGSLEETANVTLEGLGTRNVFIPCSKPSSRNALLSAACAPTVW